MGALIAMTKEQFDPVEFLEGAKLAFTVVRTGTYNHLKLASISFV